jgi:hypothetical protein
LITNKGLLSPLAIFRTILLKGINDECWRPNRSWGLLSRVNVSVVAVREGTGPITGKKFQQPELKIAVGGRDSA